MRRRLCQALLLFVGGAQAAVSLCCVSPALSGPHSQKALSLTIDAQRPVNRFRADEALGAGVDGLEHGDIDKVFETNAF